MGKRMSQEKEVVTGDYMSSKKLLVNVGEHRRGWLDRVAGLVNDGTVSDVIRVLIDQAANEDPQAFATKLQKMKLKQEVERIEQAERELAQKKQRLIESLEARPGRHVEGREGRVTA